MSSVTCPATMSAAVTTAGPAAVGPQRSNLITISTRLYGLRMNPRSVPCGQNHRTRRSEEKPRWEPAEKGHEVSVCLPARCSNIWDDLLMQGFERMDRQLLDAAALAGQLVPRGGMFAFLATHRGDVFPDADYADLFAAPGVGRPSLPTTQMAAVMALQALHDYSDRETRRGGPVRCAVEGGYRRVAGRCGV